MRWNIVFGIKNTFWELQYYLLIHGVPNVEYAFAIIAVEVHLKVWRVEIVVLTEFGEIGLMVDEPSDQVPFDFFRFLKYGQVLSAVEEYLMVNEFFHHQFSIVAEVYPLVVMIREDRVNELEMCDDVFASCDFDHFHLHKLHVLTFKSALASVHSHSKPVTQEGFHVYTSLIWQFPPKQHTLLVPIPVKNGFLFTERIEHIAF